MRTPSPPTTPQIHNAVRGERGETHTHTLPSHYSADSPRRNRLQRAPRPRPSGVGRPAGRRPGAPGRGRRGPGDPSRRRRLGDFRGTRRYPGVTRIGRRAPGRGDAAGRAGRVTVTRGYPSHHHRPLCPSSGGRTAGPALSGSCLRRRSNTPVDAPVDTPVHVQKRSGPLGSLGPLPAAHGRAWPCARATAAANSVRELVEKGARHPMADSAV